MFKSLGFSNIYNLKRFNKIMKNEITVADVMTRKPITISPKTNLLDCAKKMLKNKVGALLIVDKNKKLVGYIAQKEILWAIVKKSKNLGGIKAIDISARKLTTIPPKLTIKEAMKRMKKYKRLPVVQKGELVGLLSAKDILNFNPYFYPEFEEMTKIREESEKLKRLKKVGYKTSQGYCEECGNYGAIYSSEGRSICGECRAE